MYLIWPVLFTFLSAGYVYREELLYVDIDPILAFMQKHIIYWIRKLN